jgi:hypothetical protein
MAAKGGNQKTRKANPMLTKTGKPRLGPLNVTQLTTLLDGARNKHKAKIQRAIANRLQTQTFGKSAEPVATE